MSISINLEGKVALVTGGTRGIGKSIVDQLLISGAQVIATGTNSETIEKLNKENNNSLLTYLQLNLNDSENVQSFLKKILDYSKVDILINNAGINIVSEAIEIKEKDFQKIQEVNVQGPFLLSKVLGAKMIQNRWGRIINIASIWSVVTRPGRLAYSASKMGLLGINKTLAVEWAKHDVLVNAVSPGFTLTELTETTNTKEELEVIKNKIPQNRMASPKEIAMTVIFLASELNTYIVGQNITIDGGYTAI